MPTARFPQPIRALLGAVALALDLAAAPGGPPRTVDELKAFFAENCVRCHGEDGSAHNPDGSRRPGLDFTKAAVDFRELTGPASRRERRVMIRTIRNGILFGRTMPSWKAYLSEEEAERMVDQVLLRAEKGRIIGPADPPASDRAAQPPAPRPEP